MSRIHFVPKTIFKDDSIKVVTIGSIDFNSNLEREEIGLLTLRKDVKSFYFAPTFILISKGVLPPLDIEDFDSYCTKAYETTKLNKSYRHHSLSLNSMCKVLLKEFIET